MQVANLIWQHLTCQLAPDDTVLLIGTNLPEPWLTEAPGFGQRPAMPEINTLIHPSIIIHGEVVINLAIFRNIQVSAGILWIHEFYTNILQIGRHQR